MATQAVTALNCPDCRTQFTAPVQQMIDAQEDPEAKSRLLSGQLNAIVCPHCGFRGVLNTPFFYHDSELELALVYMPLEVGATDRERQKAIGDLTNRLMQRLPSEARKGYLLQPRTYLTVENLIDALLEEDHETRELVEAQRRKLELFEQLRELDPEDNLAVAEFIGANDEEIDETFFQMLDVIINLSQDQADAPALTRLTQHRANLLEKSSTGKILKAQSKAVEALTANPTRDTLIEELVSAEDRQVRQALVTVGRQLLDYAFFQALTARIESSADEEEKQRLVDLRHEVQEIRDDVDKIAAAVLEDRAQLLRNLMLEDNPREMLLQHLPEIDQVFLGLLVSNVQQAESEGRNDVARRLRGIGDAAIQLVQEFAPPEIKVINQLVAAENDEQVRQLLEQERDYLDQAFLDLVEDAAADLERTQRPEGAARLRYAAEYMKGMIAD